MITAVAEPPRPKRISAAGELTTRSKAEDKRVEVEQVEVDMYAEVTDPENPLLRRAKSEPAPTASQERTMPVPRLPSASQERTAPVPRSPPIDDLHAEARTDRDVRAVAQPTLSTRRRAIPKPVLYAAAGSIIAILIIVIARGGGESSPSPSQMDAVVEMTPDARRTADPKEDRAWIESECDIARTDKNWLALERCGRALSERDARAGHALVDLAGREGRAEVSLRQLREAAAIGDLTAAATEAAAIPETSVYRTEVIAILRLARRAFVDEHALILETQATAHDCDRYEATLSEIQNRHGQPLRDEIAAAAKPCKPRTAASPGGNTVVVRDDPDPPDLDALPDTPNKPLDCADSARLDQREIAADAAMSKGAFATALASFEPILKCKSTVLVKAYLAACRARNFTRAKVHYTRIGKESLAQICMKEGFDPRK